MRALILSLIATLLMAGSYTLKEAPGRSTVYEKAPERTDRSLSPSRNIYYINGDRDRPIEARNRIVVSFTEEPNLERFMAAFDLSNPRRINRLYHSWLFEIAPGADPVALSAEIAAKRDDLRYAKPEWIATNRRAK